MKWCWRTQDSPPLYVILPYFNFCGFKTRKRLFEDFVFRYSRMPGVRFVVVEATSPAPLPSLPVWKHIVVPTKHTLWLKENLVNIGAKSLPADWKYISWIDADILFLNAEWVEETKECLEVFDVVQLFQSAVNLGPRGETIKVDKSFGYMHSQSGTPYTLNDKYGFWHPGYAWACTRKAWDKMGGLIDWAILGSADRHMALAWIGKSDLSRPGNIHTNYKKLLRDFEQECKGFKVGNINGTILHEWHGSIENRKYKERWSILIDHNFDPITDIGITKSGVIQFTNSGLKMEKDMKMYFQGRLEDSLR
jgi:hypothetical protein